MERCVLPLESKHDASFAFTFILSTPKVVLRNLQLLLMRLMLDWIQIRKSSFVTLEIILKSEASGSLCVMVSLDLFEGGTWLNVW
jgi:hypothetical protein